MSGLIRGEFLPSHKTWHMIAIILLSFGNVRGQDVDIFKGKCDGYKAGVGMTVIGISILVNSESN